MAGYINREQVDGGDAESPNIDNLEEQIKKQEIEMSNNTKEIGKLQAMLGANPMESMAPLNQNMMDAKMGNMGMGMGMRMGMGPQKNPQPGATSSSTGQPPSTKSGVRSFFSKPPIDPAAAAAKAEAKAAAKAAEAAAKAKRNADAKAFKDEQIQKEKKIGLTRRKGLLGRASDGVKNFLNNKTQKQKPDTPSSSGETPASPPLGVGARFKNLFNNKTQKPDPASSSGETPGLFSRFTRKNKVSPLASPASPPAPPPPAAAPFEQATPHNPDIPVPTRAPPPPPAAAPRVTVLPPCPPE